MDFISDAASISDVRKALAHLPTAKEDFYKRSIERIKERSDSERTLMVLGWILYAKQQLTTGEIEHAIAAKSGHVCAATLEEDVIKAQILVDRCYGLVAISPESQVISFTHATVREYLQTAGMQNEVFSVDIEAEISQACLTYLSLDKFENGPCYKYSDLKARLAEFPFLKYASENWGFHANTVLERNPRVEMLAVDFLQKSGSLLSADQAMYLLSEGFPEDVSALHMAAHFDLRKINALNRALGAASLQGHEQVVKLLLKAAAHVNRKGRLYDNALIAASVGGHEQVVELLLKASADVNAHEGRSNALFAASGGGHEQVVKLLLKAGADVSVQEGLDDPLWAASAGGYEQVVKLLLEAGADVNADDSALWSASQGGHEQVVKLLLGAGADITLQGPLYGEVTRHNGSLPPQG